MIVLVPGAKDLQTRICQGAEVQQKCKSADVKRCMVHVQRHRYGDVEVQEVIVHVQRRSRCKGAEVQ